MSFVGLYTGLSGIRAAQTGIDTVSNNVANTATPGYTRQRVNLSPSHSFQSAVGQIGTGVTVDGVARLRDVFLDDRFRQAIGDHGEASVRGNLLAQFEQLTGEPEQGISLTLGRLWNAVESWSNDPNSSSTRQEVLAELSSVTDTIRSVSAAWDALEADVTTRLETTAVVASDRLQTLDELNRRIVGMDPKRIGNDLLDQRDRLLDEVAKLTGAEAGIDETGRAVVSVGGQDLLSADGAARLEVVGGQIQALQPPDDTAVTLEGLGGELGGLQRVLTDDLPALREELDAFAATLAAAVNETNRAGLRADGDAGEDLLAFDAGAAASSIRLADGVGIADLAAASPDPDDPGAPVAPHDASNAIRFAQLRNARIDDSGLRDPAGVSLDSRFGELSTRLAGDVRASASTAEAARSTFRSAEFARTSEHGVSIDEEMVDLVRYQRALEAASRVMTTVDEALEVLVNRTGVVGR